MQGARRHKLATARVSVGYTQEALANALQVDRSTVQRWEAGTTRPWPHLWPRLSRLLGVDRDGLAELLTNSDDQVTIAGAAEVEDDMRRRTFFTGAAAVAATASINVTSGASVGMADVRRLQREDQRLWNLDQQHGGASLWHAALAHAQEGALLLENGRYSDPVATELLAITGRLYVCAGYLAFDAGRHDIARGCFNEALTMGRQAQDFQLEMRALGDLALQANTTSRPGDALKYAAAAEQVIGRDDARAPSRAIPQLRIAIASSQMGDHKAADQAVTRARRTLENDDQQPRDEWSAFLTPAELDGIEGTCMVELGRPERAQDLFERAIAEYPPQFARNRALYNVRLARAQLDMNDIDASIAATDHALDDLTGQVASQRVTGGLRQVINRLGNKQHIDGVAPLVERAETVAG